ncbi:MAG TPA: ribokinase [Patescibacteria group bacterium]
MINQQKKSGNSSKDKVTICVVGSINMDLVLQMNKLPVRGETVVGNTIQHIPGGKGANQAVAASRLGGKVNFIGRIGTDNFGTELFNFLKSENLNLEGIKKSKTNSGLAIVAVDSRGQNSIIIFPGSNGDVKPKSLVEHTNLIEESDVIVAQYEIPMKTVEALLIKAKQLNKITVLNPAPAKITSEKIFSHVDYLIVNQTELAFFMETEKMLEDIDEIIIFAKKLREKGPKNVIVTLGDRGAIAVTEKGVLHSKTVKVNVVDTTAAGDCFVGAFATQIGKGIALEECLNFANKAAALSVQRLGASNSLPYLDDVLHMDGDFLGSIPTEE